MRLLFVVHIKSIIVETSPVTFETALSSDKSSLDSLPQPANFSFTTESISSFFSLSLKSSVSLRLSIFLSSPKIVMYLIIFSLSSVDILYCDISRNDFRFDLKSPSIPDISASSYPFDLRYLSSPLLVTLL